MIASLLVAAALAGAPEGFTPGVEGQQGFGAPVVSPDGTRVALTTWNNQGLWVYDLAEGELVQVSDARGAGFHPEWSGETLLFKAIRGGESPRQQVSRWTDGRVEVLDEGGQQGQPAALPDGALLWTDGRDLRLRDGATERTLPGVGDVHLLAPDPAGGRVAYDDANGRLVLRDLSSGRARVLADAGVGSHPQWSADGAFLLHRGTDGRFVVLDPETGRVVGRAAGTHPVWVPGEHVVVFERVTTGTLDDSDIEDVAKPTRLSALGTVGAVLAGTASSLWRLDADTGEVSRVLSTPRLHPRYPAAVGDDLLFVDTVTGDLWRLRDGVPSRVLGALDAGSSDDAPSDAPPPPDYPSTSVWVPYLHQLWDTPDDYNGGWSCGPTSNLQVLGKWSVLPSADITCSWPYAHTSHWGWYVPNAYSFAGYTYDTWGEAESAWVQGAHGFICREYGGAVWAYMTTFMAQHGVESAQVGTDYSTLVGQVDAGYPMYASVYVLGYGHIIAPRGYMTDGGSPIHSIIVNDPYGNAGSGDWGNYDGDGIAYDWPGYNNGHLEIEVSQLFTAHGADPVVETTPTEPEDTGTATPVDTGTPADTGAASTEDTTPSTTPSDNTDDEPVEYADAPGSLLPKAELGGCSTAPGAAGWAGLLGLAGLLARRREVGARR